MTTNENGQNDRALLARVLRGEIAAVDVFVNRMSCISGVLGHLNRRRGNPLSEQDLLELSQDVFERIWKRLDEFRGEAALETWVYNFCVNTFANRVRMTDRRRNREVHSEIVGEPSVARNDALAEVDAALLITALEQLPEIDRRIIRLRLFEGQSFDMVGQQLGMLGESAKTRYYRAMARLHDRLAGKFGEEDSA